MYGDVICDNENCPYIDDIGNCTDINAKCKYEKQRNDAVRHYAFANDKPVEITGSCNEKGNNRIGQSNNFTDQNPKTEEELLKSLGLGLTRQTLQNYKKLTEILEENRYKLIVVY